MGSSLVSLALGHTPSFITNPEYVLTFLVAFCLVRSDSIEARELSGHMRYAAPLPIALNLAAALYKMRSLSHVVEAMPPLLGPACTLLYGTLAFSACNALMWVEARLLARHQASCATRKPAATPAAVQQLELSTPCAQAPNLCVTLSRHFGLLAVLLASHGSGSKLLYSTVKVCVLGCLFSNYNLGLLKAPPADDGHASTEARAGGATEGRSSSQMIMDTLHLPSPAKSRASRPMSVASASETWAGVALLWVIGLLSIGTASTTSHVARRVARPSTSMLQGHGPVRQPATAPRRL